MSTIVEKLSDVYSALEHEVDVSGHGVTIKKASAGKEIETRLLVGRAQDLTESHLRDVWPERVIIEDDPPKTSYQRLVQLCERFSEPDVFNFSGFVDFDWDASGVVERAMARSTSAADASLPEAMRRSGRPDPQRDYVDQRLALDGESVFAINACDDWLDGPPGMFGVLARAGLGKSELTRVFQWRSGLTYLNASKVEVPNGLPPVALRVELRELRELSLRAMAEYFRDYWGEKLLGREEVLSALLLSSRLVLLLDGLDELQLSRDEIGAGLRALFAQCEDEGRVMITSRPGYYGRESPLLNALEGRGHVGRLETLSRAKAIELMRGTDQTIQRGEAERLLVGLPESLQGVPLFLIWTALSRGYTDAETEAESLLDLVAAFCERDEDRVQLPSHEQTAILKQMSYEIALRESDSLLKEDAAYLVGAEHPPFLDAPHALLHFPDPDKERVGFSDKTFESLFLAERIQEIWIIEEEHGGLRDWLREFLNRRDLDDLTIEYLAQLVEEERIARAWSLSSRHSTARRNLLGIALEKVRRMPTRDDPKKKAEALQAILDSRDLSSTRLRDLTIERFAFEGWDLRDVDPEGAYIAFNAFEGANVDRTLRNPELASYDNTGLESAHQDLERGRRRLLEIVESFRNRRVSSTALHRRLADDTRGLDTDGLTELRRIGFLDNQPGSGGTVFWMLQPSGRRVFAELIRDPECLDDAVREAVERLN